MMTPIEFDKMTKDRDDKPNKSLRWIIVFAIAISVICYITSVALVQFAANLPELKEEKNSIDNMTLVNLYAIMVIGSTVFMPCDDITNQIRCLKYLKLAFIVVSLLMNLISLCMCTMLLCYNDVQVMTAVAVQTMGIVFHGLYLRLAAIRIFQESDYEPEEPRFRDSLPLCGISELRYNIP